MVGIHNHGLPSREELLPQIFESMVQGWAGGATPRRAEGICPGLFIACQIPGGLAFVSCVRDNSAVKSGLQPGSPMNALLALWLPILLSAGVVFIISSLIHMVIKWHAPDYRGFPNEDAVRAAIRAGSPAPGRYVLPWCSDMKAMGSEAMLARYREGPVGHVTLAPAGAPSIGRSLGQWFVLSLLVAATAALVASQAYGLDPARSGAAALLIGIVSFVAHGFGTLSESIWMARPWSSSIKYILDAALYAAGSAAVFYWLWP